MLCSYKLWVQVSYPPHLKLLNQNSNIPIPKTKTQFQRKSLDSRFDDIDDDADGSGLRKFALPSHVKSITSTSNPFVKHCLKLKNSSSYRHSHASALVVGTTPIREIYSYKESSQEKTVIDCLLLLENAEIPEGLDTHSCHVVRIGSMVMKKLSGVQSAESIEAIALMRFPTSFLNLTVDQNKSDSQSWFPSTHRILVLDGIQDPGNLGTLIRSAMAFQWLVFIVLKCLHSIIAPDSVLVNTQQDGIFLLPGCCDPFNEKALRASRGASFQLPIVSGSWYHLQTLKDAFNMKMLAGHPDIDGKLKKPFSLSQEFVHSVAHVPSCLVLGSEGRGLSKKSQLKCELVSIPMTGKFESLNVSVAGGIFLYMLQPKN
ncbi:putative tRNA/rRNA methyltransferase isoform X1 [Gossypium australe]|uniref:Putative tRNA/rRNA methyltransferase isoform X1 n=1 Tax=Gossypium australe TaxID=47621 RepID=A0A5B6V4Q2_9ROSI|nr:putative tRNA/rRNA methyltransferase isoform X1 [Gossypium australe]